MALVLLCYFNGSGGQEDQSFPICGGGCGVPSIQLTVGWLFLRSTEGMGHIGGSGFLHWGHSQVLSFCKSGDLLMGSGGTVHLGLISFDCWGRAIDEPLSLLIVTDTRQE